MHPFAHQAHLPSPDVRSLWDLIFRVTPTALFTANFPLGFAPENGPHQVSSFLWETQEKALFRGTWWGPFSGARQSGKLPLFTV